MRYRDLIEAEDYYLERYGVPHAVVQQYSEGECLYLALAMAERFGWPILCQMDSDLKYIAHAYCKMPDGREIDILGPQDKVDVYDDHVEEWSIDRMRKHIAHYSQIGDTMREANETIDRYILPKLKGIEV